MKILIPRGMSGLGALGPSPPNSMLKPGMMWLRYMVPDQYGRPSTRLQETRCPSPAPWGCWIWEGYAWGQVPTTGEFQSGTPTSTVPSPAQIAKTCSDSYAAWKVANPRQAACLSAEDQYQFASLCSAVLTSQLTKATMRSRWDAYVERRCRGKCNRAYKAWREEHPKQAKCVPYDEGHDRYMRICLRVIAGELSPEQGTKNWNTWVKRWCDAAGAPPPPADGGGDGDADGGGGEGPVDAPVPTKPVLEDVPDVTESPDGLPPGSGVRRGDELVDSIVKGDGMDTSNGGANGAVEEKSFLRRVGPIVGIGLVLAVGGIAAWQYQMKKKGQRRRRR